MLYPADPPTVEEIVCVMRHASEDSSLSTAARAVERRPTSYFVAVGRRSVDDQLQSQDKTGAPAVTGPSKPARWCR
jgi:hypothetical protein